MLEAKFDMLEDVGVLQASPTSCTTTARLFLVNYDLRPALAEADKLKRERLHAGVDVGMRWFRSCGLLRRVEALKKQEAEFGKRAGVARADTGEKKAAYDAAIGRGDHAEAMRLWDALATSRGVSQSFDEAHADIRAKLAAAHRDLDRARTEAAEITRLALMKCLGESKAILEELAPALAVALIKARAVRSVALQSVTDLEGYFVLDPVADPAAVALAEVIGTPIMPPDVPPEMPPEPPASDSSVTEIIEEPCPAEAPPLPPRPRKSTPVVEDTQCLA